MTKLKLFYFESVKTWQGSLEQITMLGRIEGSSEKRKTKYEID